MHVVPIATPNGAEQAVVDALSDMPGVVVTNALIPGRGGRTREVDAVLFSPAGVFVIEAKGTSAAGTVTTDPNADWRTATGPLDLAGGSNPLRQARTGAQTLAAFLRENDLALGFVQAAIAISSPAPLLFNTPADPTPHHSLTVGDTLVTSVAHLVDTLTAAQRSKPLDAEAVAAAANLLGAALDPAALTGEGFPLRGTAEHREARRTQVAARQRDELHDAAAPLPGVLVGVPRSAKGGHPAGYAAVAVTPRGVYAIRTYATHHQGDVRVARDSWTIGDSPLATGAHSTASRLASSLWHKLKAHDLHIKVHPVATLSGTNLNLAVTRAAGVWFARTTDLAGVMLRCPETTIDLETAQRILTALGHTVAARDLTAAGFTPAPARSPGHNPADAARGAARTTGARESSTDRRTRHREERRLAFQERAFADWQARHRRRHIGSLLALTVLCYSLTFLPLSELAWGAGLAAAAAAAELWLRSRRDGDRMNSPWAGLGWVFTLVPYVGVGTCGHGLFELASAHTAQGALAVMLSAMCLLLHALTLLTGRSGFIYPPAVVLERHDQDGKPTGTYLLSSDARTAASTHSTWQPVS